MSPGCLLCPNREQPRPLGVPHRQADRAYRTVDSLQQDRLTRWGTERQAHALGSPRTTLEASRKVPLKPERRHRLMNQSVASGTPCTAPKGNSFAFSYRYNHHPEGNPSANTRLLLPPGAEQPSPDPPPANGSPARPPWERYDSTAASGSPTQAANPGASRALAGPIPHPVRHRPA